MPDYERTHSPHDDDDFGVWVTLARDQPADFEQIRRETLSAFIEQSGRHTRVLRRFQAQIDVERTAAPTPFDACVQLMLHLSQIEPQLRALLDTVESHPHAVGRE